MGEEEMVVGDGWISDDSSFYGDGDEQDRLSSLCEEFRPTNYWAARKDELNSIVFKHRNVPPPNLSNPGEGQPECWQPSETAEDFVKRLPPLTTSGLGWIWVHNPYPHDHGKTKAVYSNVHDFTSRGQELLVRSIQTRQDIETKSLKKTKSAVMRLLNEESKLLLRRIADLAAETNVLSGKWMLFPPLEDLNRVWRLVVDGVINDRLGPTAKVAPDEGKSDDRLICIYTKDFRDKDDITRVLREIASMGVTGQRRKKIDLL
ncbi:hypothetical protein N0V90_002496 [Kalmusia sp. IMI 367209]|nr:hypothetical protein N0V90_002496 [Kalmusia sp. IMI 367209]